MACTSPVALQVVYRGLRRRARVRQSRALQSASDAGERQVSPPCLATCQLRAKMPAICVCVAAPMRCSRKWIRLAAGMPTCAVLRYYAGAVGGALMCNDHMRGHATAIEMRYVTRERPGHPPHPPPLPDPGRGGGSPPKGGGDTWGRMQETQTKPTCSVA